VAAVAALVLVPASFAGKGGGGGKPGGGGTTTGGGTIALVLINSTDGVAHFGQKVTFSVSTSSTSQPWVDLTCSQNGTVVSKQANGIFATSLNQTFTLGPTGLWTGGAADCTAALQNWSSSKRTTLATMTFHVYA
jgi:hypothetical protein